MRYTFTFGHNAQLVWALIFPAFIGLIPLWALTELSIKYLPGNDWASLIITILYIAFVVFITLKWVRSIRVDIDIEFKEGRIHFNFPVKNIFHRKDFILNMPDLVNISEDNDKGFDFLYIETKNTPYPKFHLMAEDTNESFSKFKEQFYLAIEAYGSSGNRENKITHKTIYQKWPLKLIAVLCLAGWFIFPFVLFSGDNNWYSSAKYWVFVALSCPIIFKVYTQNFLKAF